MEIIQIYDSYTRVRIAIIFLISIAVSFASCSVRDQEDGNGHTQGTLNKSSNDQIFTEEQRKHLIALPSTFFFESESGLAICRAIEDKDMMALNDLIASGVDLNRQEKGGITVLFWAFMKNNLDAFKMFLDHGANPDLSLNFDESLRHAFTGKADPNPKRPYGTSFSYWNESVIYSIVTKWPSRHEFLEPALKASRDPSHSDVTGGTLYHRCAVFYADPRLIEILLKYPIDLNVQNVSGETACAYLLRNGKHAACLQLLKHGADPSICDKEGKNLQAILNIELAAISRQAQTTPLSPAPAAPDSNGGVWPEGTLGYGLGRGRLDEIQDWLAKNKK